MKNKTQGYRRDIDALRGISVLLVVIYHAFPEFLTGGFIGVDVFFVISGYLITNIIVNQINAGNFNFTEFYNRRIRRILPPLIAVLSTSLIAGWLIMLPDEFKQLGSHALSSSIFVQNFNLINELGYFDVSSHYKPLLHLWTLSIEEQYYLLWPAVLVAIFKLRADPLKILSVIVAASFLLNIYFVNDYKNEVFFHSATRFWELGIGSLLAIYSLKHNFTACPRTRYILFTIGLVFIIFASVYLNARSLYPSWAGLLPTFGAAMIIAANVSFKNWGGLVNVGLISYPLYLWHWVIISFLYIYIGKKPNIEALLFAVLIAFFLSYLTYKYIEKIRYIKSDYTAIALASCALLVAGIGVLVYKNDGLVNRPQFAYVSELKIQLKRTPMTDKACVSYVRSVLQEKHRFDYCRSEFNKNNKKIIAVIGDSHAHVLFPGIAKVARERGFNTILLANSSCPPLIGFNWGRNPKAVKECQSKILQIMQTLQSDPRIEKVIITTRGPTYIHGDVKGKITPASVRKSLKTFCCNSKVMNYSTYFAGYKKTLDQLDSIQHIRRIYYFLENPELDFLPKEVIARPFDYFDISTRHSTVDYDLYLMRMKKYRDLVYKTSTPYNKTIIVDVGPYLCDKKKCHAVKDGEFLYADDDHYSVFGSIYIANKTKEIIFSR